MSDDIEIKLDGLSKLAAALKVKPPMARVGILGSKDERVDEGQSNATIGAIHEFGTSSMPMRSFLRIPLSYGLQEALEQAGAFTESAFKKVIAEKSLAPWVEKVAIAAVGVVLDAFDTGGNGSWPAVLPETMRRKKIKQILVETTQLRDSISYEVRA